MVPGSTTISQCEKVRCEQAAITWPLCTLFLMAGLGLFFARLANSKSLELDALICLIDVGISAITLWVSRVSRRSRSSRYPVGPAAWVPLLNTAKGVFLAAICISGLVDAVRIIIEPGAPVDFRWPALYACILFSLEFTNFLYVRYVGRRINSSLLDTEAKEWFAESTSSLLIVFAFVVSWLLQDGPFDAYTAYVDPLVAILLVAATLPLAVSVLRRNVAELLLRQAGDEDVSAVRDVFDDVFPQFRDHAKAFTVLRVGDKLLADIFVLLRDEESRMTIHDADQLRAQLLRRLRELPDEVEAKLTLTRVPELLAA
jgi:predicted Co/Zn/Cd cation transporter (cation efflux family)